MTDILIPLVTLTLLEIVLGVDNVIFISILSGKLPPDQQRRARRVGLMAAMGMRLILLWSIVWVSRLTTPLFEVFGRGLSGRDLILIGGGLFLLGKATYEIHENLEGGMMSGYEIKSGIPIPATAIVASSNLKDKDKGMQKGLSQFLDDKSYRPGFESLKN